MRIFLVLLALLLATPMAAQNTAPEGDRQGVSLDDLVKLTSGGVPDEVVLLMIEKDCLDFSLDADAAIALAGVSATVIQAVRACADEPASQTAGGAAGRQPSATLPAVRKLSQEDLIQLAVNGIDEGLVLEMVSTRCVSFPLDADTAINLTGKVSGQVLQAVDSCLRAEASWHEQQARIAAARREEDERIAALRRQQQAERERALWRAEQLAETEATMARNRKRRERAAKRRRSVADAMAGIQQGIDTANATNPYARLPSPGSPGGGQTEHSGGSDAPPPNLPRGTATPPPPPSREAGEAAETSQTSRKSSDTVPGTPRQSGDLGSFGTDCDLAGHDGSQEIVKSCRRDLRSNGQSVGYFTINPLERREGQVLFKVVVANQAACVMQVTGSWKKNGNAYRLLEGAGSSTLEIDPDDFYQTEGWVSYPKGSQVSFGVQGWFSCR